MTKIKAGIIAADLSGRGGTETVLFEFVTIKQLQDLFDFEVVLTDGMSKETPWLKKIKAKVRVKNFLTNHNINIFRKIWYYVKTDNEVVIVLGPKSIFLAFWIRKIFRKRYKIISWMHFSIFNLPGLKTEYLKYADYHFAIATDIKRQLIELGISTDKIFTIYNPVLRTDELIPMSTDDILRLIYVGRLEIGKQKNCNGIFEILKRISPEKKVEISIYGDGVERQKIEAIAENLLSTKDNVKVNWNGWVNDVWKDIKQADALILNSNYEGFGMVLTEAISRGLPVISTDFPVGAKDIIQNNVNGYLFEIDDQVQAAKIIENFDQTKFANKLEIKKSIEILYNENYTQRIIDAFKSMGITKNRGKNGK